MKFGDIVINEWAGDTNPNKVLMIVSVGKVIKCLTKTGKRAEFCNDKRLKLTKVGKVNFEEWFSISTDSNLKETKQNNSNHDWRQGPPNAPKGDDGVKMA